MDFKEAFQREVTQIATETDDDYTEIAYSENLTVHIEARGVDGSVGVDVFVSGGERPAVEDRLREVTGECSQLVSEIESILSETTGFSGSLVVTYLGSDDVYTPPYDRYSSQTVVV